MVVVVVVVVEEGGEEEEDPINYLKTLKELRHIHYDIT